MSRIYHVHVIQSNPLFSLYSISQESRTIIMSTFVPSMNRNRQQRPPPPPEMVGKLQLKLTSHWNNIDNEHWKNCGLSIQQSWSWRDRRLRKYNVNTAMVHLQRELVNAARCRGNKMVLSKVLSKYRWRNKEGRTSIYYRCPFHNDLLPNWEQFAEQLESYNGGIERFVINKVMLPTQGLGLE